MTATPRPHVDASLRSLVADPETFATVLLLIAVDLWGMDCLQDAEDQSRGAWHPTTFKSMLEQRLGVTVPQCNLDKLMAAVTLVTTDLFYKNLDRFIILANILAGDEFDPTTFEKADTMECAWAITEALLIAPPDNDSEAFCDEIRHYVGAVLVDDGFISPPDVLKIALDADVRDQVRYNFADDPEMFSGIYAVQQGKTEDVETVIYSGLQEMYEQLTLLPLQEGTTEDLRNKLEQLLKTHARKVPTGPEGVL